MLSVLSVRQSPLSGRNILQAVPTDAAPEVRPYSPAGGIAEIVCEVVYCYDQRAHYAFSRILRTVGCTADRSGFQPDGSRSILLRLSRQAQLLPFSQALPRYGCNHYIPPPGGRKTSSPWIYPELYDWSSYWPI